MEYNAFITSLGVGAFYVIASHRFLRLYRRTGMWPELWLCLYFALTSVFYLQLELPSLLGLDSWPPAMGIAFEWVYVLGVFAYLFFIRSAFRPGSFWANVVVGICSALLLVGTVLGTRAGPVEYSLDNPCFLAQWIGYTIPCAWIGWEALRLRRGAKRRARIGLCPPVVANRYLLLILFGSFQLLACLADLAWAIDLGAGQSVSTASDLLLGFAEFASVSVLWLAFFPPLFYTDWVTRTAVILPTPMDG
jgi:hypothetical protein